MTRTSQWLLFQQQANESTQASTVGICEHEQKQQQHLVAHCLSQKVSNCVQRRFSKQRCPLTRYENQLRSSRVQMRSKWRMFWNTMPHTSCTTKCSRLFSLTLSESCWLHQATSFRWTEVTVWRLSEAFTIQPTLRSEATCNVSILIAESNYVQMLFFQNVFIFALIILFIVKCI